MNSTSTHFIPAPPQLAFRKLTFCEEVRMRFSAAYPDLCALSNMEGKHLRLELAAAGSEWGLKTESEREALFHGALAIQMAHEASLFHDDIIDQGKVRRGRKTLFCESGPGASLIAGDQFLTSAYREAAATGSAAFFRLFAEGVAAVVSGELLQNAHRRTSIGRPLYQKIIGMKTGALFGLSLSLPSILTNDPLSSQVLELGNRIGSFYQMLDDFLDYCQWASSGKKPYTDYQSGVWTFVAGEIEGFEFGWETEQLQKKLSENKSAPLARALAVIRKEAEFLLAKVRLYFGGESPIEAILKGWEERAENAFHLEKSHFLLEETLRRHFPPGDSRSFFSRNSRSFSFAALFFPKEIREKIIHLYGFCRITDDLADGELGIEAAERSGVLEAWRSLACRSYSGESTSIAVLDLAMRDMREGKVPFRYAEELIAGVLMDQNPRVYETRTDLALYTYRVASVVGQWITELSGCHDPETLVEAARLGHAMQMTNILRDVGEDLQTGRIYLPEEALREFDLRSHYLLGFSTQPIHPVYAGAIESLLREAEADYDKAFLAIPRLPPAFRIPVALAAEIYRGIHQEIRKNGYDHFRYRSRVSFFSKLKLALRALAKLYRISQRAA